MLMMFTCAVVHLQVSTKTDYIPDVVCDYRPPDSCNPNDLPLPCCQRPEVVGDTISTTTTASGVMVLSSLLLMAAMNLVTLLLYIV